MNLNNLRERAKLERLDIAPALVTLAHNRELFPDGVDVCFSPALIPNLQQYCDANNIPFYHVTGTCCSTAETYTALLCHEESR